MELHPIRCGRTLTQVDKRLHLDCQYQSSLWRDGSTIRLFQANIGSLANVRFPSAIQPRFLFYIGTFPISSLRVGNKNAPTGSTLAYQSPLITLDTRGIQGD